MSTSAETVYLDSSALVKLILAEAESDALDAFLQRYVVRASSTLASVEVIRAVRPHGHDSVPVARTTLDALFLRKLDDELLDAAADLGSPVLRTLDSIHIATALSFGSELAFLVTYDNRMIETATSLGIPVASPGR